MESPRLQINSTNSSQKSKTGDFCEKSAYELTDSSNDNIILENRVGSLDLGEKSNSDSKLICCTIESDSERVGIINVVVSAIGGGCFFYPYILSQLGIILGFIIFSIVSACIYFSLDLLRSFVVDTKFFSYSLITETISGKNWLTIYLISSFLIYIMMEVNYVSLIHSYCTTVIDKSKDWLVQSLIFLASGIFEVLLSLIVSKISNIHIVSLISFICFILILLSIIILSFIGGNKNTVSIDLFFYKKDESSSAGVWILNTISFIMQYLYGYTYHSTFPTLIGNLKNPTEVSTKKVHNISFLFIFVSYILISFFGIMISNQQVPYVLFDDVEYNERNEIDKEKIILQLALVFFLLTVIPIRFIVVKDNYLALKGRKIVTFKDDVFMAIIFIVSSNFICFLNLFTEQNVEALREFIQIFYGIFGVLICFILPVFNYAAVNGKKKIKSLIGYAISLIFGIIGVIDAIYSVYKMKDIWFKKKEEDL